MARFARRQAGSSLVRTARNQSQGWFLFVYVCISSFTGIPFFFNNRSPFLFLQESLAFIRESLYFRVLTENQFHPS